MFRKAIDGGIWVPLRGKTIEPPEGYYADKPNHFYKIRHDCRKLIITRSINPSCGCKKETWTCTNGETRQVSRVLCERCQASWWKESYPNGVDYNA